MVSRSPFGPDQNRPGSDDSGNWPPDRSVSRAAPTGIRTGHRFTPSRRVPRPATASGLHHDGSCCVLASGSNGRLGFRPYLQLENSAGDAQPQFHHDRRTDSCRRTIIAQPAGRLRRGGAPTPLSQGTQMPTETAQLQACQPVLGQNGNFTLDRLLPGRMHRMDLKFCDGITTPDWTPDPAHSSQVSTPNDPPILRKRTSPRSWCANLPRPDTRSAGSRGPIPRALRCRTSDKARRS
jgi:hypothetical protein